MVVRVGEDQEAAATQSAYARMREDFLAFLAYVMPAQGPFELPIPHHIVQIADELQLVGDRENNRLIVTVPPQHGKSTTVAQAFAAWWIGRNPHENVVIGCYDMKLARRNTLYARRIVESERFQRVFPGIKVASDQGAADEWGVEGHRGGYKAVSVGAGTTGHTAHLLILDDPHQGRKAADSELERNEVHQWYTSDFLSRGNPSPARVPVIVIHTRFHRDDMTGRLLGKRDHKWRHLHLKGISDEGLPLWKPLEDYEYVRDNDLSPQDWAALYQGDPLASGGTNFEAEWFQVAQGEPPKFQAYHRHWDLALSKKKKSDYTASCLAAMDDTGTFWILDVWRRKLNAPEIHEAIIAQAKEDAELHGPASVSLPQDLIGIGIFDAIVQDPRCDFSIEKLSERQIGNKEQRAAPWASRARAGKLRVMHGPYVADLIREAVDFPNAAHDDLVDAVSGAWEKAAKGRAGLYELSELPHHTSPKALEMVGEWLREQYEAAEEVWA